MWGEAIVARNRQWARKAASKAVTDGLMQLAERIRAQGGMPLAVALPDGTRVELGQKVEVTVTVRDPAVLPMLAAPTLAQLGAAYVEGQIDVDGPIEKVISVADALAAASGAGAAQRMLASMARHTPRQDRADIQYHYDVGNAFYRLWLDERMVYSCAYFKTGTESLDTAQEAKLDHICRKLRLTPGERLLDIGCGWGGLVIHAAQRYGVSAVGITLSDQQLAWARERVAAAGLADRVAVLPIDYRDLPEHFGEGSFDKVASVGMFEHVGLRNLPLYFNVACRMLRDRGLMLNHGITGVDLDHRPVGSGVGDFIDRYVFPHGELPHLHRAISAMSQPGFEVVDVESLRPHYALTLQQWSRRLEARLSEAARCVTDRQLRIWRAYLAGCAYGFEQGWINIYQVLASKQAAAGPRSLPLTRDWMYA